MTIKERLKKELRSIWDNDEFVVGITTNVKEDEYMEIMLQYIAAANERGDVITPENITIMSVLLMNERKGITQRRT